MTDTMTSSRSCLEIATSRITSPCSGSTLSHEDAGQRKHRAAAAEERKGNKEKTEAATGKRKYVPRRLKRSLLMGIIFFVRRRARGLWACQRSNNWSPPRIQCICTYTHSLGPFLHTMCALNTNRNAHEQDRALYQRYGIIKGRRLRKKCSLRTDLVRLLQKRPTESLYIAATLPHPPPAALLSPWNRRD